MESIPIRNPMLSCNIGQGASWLMREGQFIRLPGRRDALSLAFGAIIGWSRVSLDGLNPRAGTLGALSALGAGG